MYIENRFGQIFEQLTLGRPPWFADWPWFSATEALLQRATQEIGIHYGNRLLAQGDPVAALTAAQRLIGVDPLSEAARELAIRAHIAANDRSSALSEFRRYQQLLGEELGVEPSPALRRYIEL
jgi:DNA-binding SARP family transcriptional activator